MIRLKDIIDHLHTYLPEPEVDLVRKAYVYSAKVHGGQVRLSGEPYLSHPLEVAGLLAQLLLDAQTVAAGLLHDIVEDTHVELDEIRALFGEEVAELVDGVTKISQIEAKGSAERQAENLRKMILAMAKDLRVILIKLADRLHNLRTLQYHSPRKREAIAQETIDIYAPLANRLGMGWVREELEEEAFKNLRPREYEDIRRRLATDYEERQRYIGELIRRIETELEAAGIRGQIQGRPKRLYSIYRKMLAQRIPLGEVYDLTALRIITDSVKDCYALLGIIHSLWKPIPGRFKDFVALPKGNRYQSLHTTIVGPKGRQVEFQIRTEEMHLIAEEGIASHWRYKGEEPEEGERFVWVRQLLEWQREVKDPREFLDNLKIDLFPDDVYVFTPKGDFAYRIHTDIGNRCARAKVNGKLVPLKYELQNGDLVEIETAPHQRPNQDWMRFVRTTRARSKLRAWLRVEEKERALSLGRELLERELGRYGRSSEENATEKSLEEVAGFLDLASAKDVLQAIGFGRITPRKVVSKLLPKEVWEAVSPGRTPAKEKTSGIQTLRGVKVKGIEEMPMRFAGCCNPVPGDPISGFITRGRGVSIHTADCPILQGQALETARKIPAEWDLSESTWRTVEIMLESIDEPGLLARVSSAISESDANIAHLEGHTTKSGQAVFYLGVQIRDLAHLEQLLARVQTMRGVLRAERVRSTSGTTHLRRVANP
jgi:GTP pyrophosphokinase